MSTESRQQASGLTLDPKLTVAKGMTLATTEARFDMDRYYEGLKRPIP
nr:hypothetical protein [Actinomycetota bacterium]